VVLVVRDPGYRTEMYCVYRKVRTELYMYVMKKKVDRLCSLGSEFLTTDPDFRVRFPELPDFLTSNGSGTWSTHPREYN
jgi:hypothetical protein